MNWQKRQAGLLREEIEALLTSVSHVPSLYDLVKEPLTEARRGLSFHIVSEQPWPLLPLITCEAVCGRYEHALPAAVSLQLLLTAGDVFDDIEDADSSKSLQSKYGSGIATNTATTLLILAEKAIARLKLKNVDDSIIVDIIDKINLFYTTVCIGQYLDLSFTPQKAITEEEYLRVVSMKSASQVECACYIGALLANTNRELIDILAVFGHNLGVAAQITNDIQGVTIGSDIDKRRKSLPVIYALTQADSEAQRQLELIFAKQNCDNPDITQVQDVLFRTGAIHYATVKMELYRQQAQDALSEAEKKGAHTKRLKLFLK